MTADISDGHVPAERALGFAVARLRAHLAEAGDLAEGGAISSARAALEDCMTDLADIEELLGEQGSPS